MALVEIKGFSQIINSGEGAVVPTSVHGLFQTEESRTAFDDAVSDISRGISDILGQGSDSVFSYKPNGYDVEIIIENNTDNIGHIATIVTPKYKLRFKSDSDVDTAFAAASLSTIDDEMLTTISESGAKVGYMVVTTDNTFPVGGSGKKKVFMEINPTKYYDKSDVDFKVSTPRITNKDFDEYTVANFPIFLLLVNNKPERTLLA